MRLLCSYITLDYIINYLGVRLATNGALIGISGRAGSEASRIPSFASALSQTTFLNTNSILKGNLILDSFQSDMQPY